MAMKRSSKVAFLGIQPDGDGTVTYHRMTNFTEFSTSKNAKEYTRQYVDEDFERSDVVGYSPSVTYGFDAAEGNKVHEAIVKITDGELLGDAAIVSIVLANVESEGTGDAIVREFTVIPDSEGDSTDAYTYSGTLKANGAAVKGTATTADKWLTCTFTEAV